MTRPRLSVGLCAFAAHTVLIQAITFVLRPTSTYRALELDVPVQWLGLIAASFAVVPLALALPTGQIADRFGERRVMALGCTLVLGAALVFTFASRTVTGVVVATVLLGTGHLGTVVGQQALVANSAETAGYDRAFGHYTFAAALGQAIGPGLILWFGGHRPIPDTQAIFVWSTVLAVLLAALTALLPRSTEPTTGVQETAIGSVRDLVRTPGVTRAVVVSCVVLAAIDITLVYLPALGTERDIAAGTIGVLLALRAAAAMVSRLFLGRMVSVVGRRRLLVGSILGAALALALTPVPMPAVVLGVLVTVIGFGLGVSQPVTMSWLAEATPAGMRGRAMSLRLSGNRLGQVVVPSLAGLLATSTGAGGVLLLGAVGLALVGGGARGLPEPAD